MLNSMYSCWVSSKRDLWRSLREERYIAQNFSTRPVRKKQLIRLVALLYIWTCFLCSDDKFNLKSRCQEQMDTICIGIVLLQETVEAVCVWGDPGEDKAPTNQEKAGESEVVFVSNGTSAVLAGMIRKSWCMLQNNETPLSVYYAGKLYNPVYYSCWLFVSAGSNISKCSLQDPRSQDIQ